MRDRTISQAFCDTGKRRHPLHHQGLNQASKIGARKPMAPPHDRTTQLRTTISSREEAEVLAPQRLTAQPTPTGRLSACGIQSPPERGGLGQGWQIQLYNVRVRCFWWRASPRWADMKKGALRPPVRNTTSEKNQKVRVGRTAKAKASESDISAALLMKSR